MTDFATHDDIVSGLANTETYGGRHAYRKANVGTTIGGNIYSGWLQSGWPAPGVAPTSAALCTDATVGALNRNMLNAPSGGHLRAMCWSNWSGSAQAPSLYDRIAHMGGLSANLNTSQTVNLSIATYTTRCLSTGADVEWFIEVYAIGGATSPGAITITYTNQSGVGSRSTTIASSNFGGTAATNFPVARLIPITTLQSGDTSIQSIQSIQLTTATGTAGNIGVTAMKRITPTGMHAVGNSAFSYDWSGLGLPSVGDDACVQMVYFCYTTSTGVQDGMFIIGGK